MYFQLAIKTILSWRCKAFNSQGEVITYVVVKIIESDNIFVLSLSCSPNNPICDVCLICALVTKTSAKITTYLFLCFSSCRNNELAFYFPARTGVVCASVALCSQYWVPLFACSVEAEVRMCRREKCRRQHGEGR